MVRGSQLPAFRLLEQELQPGLRGLRSGAGRICCSSLVLHHRAANGARRPTRRWELTGHSALQSIRRRRNSFYLGTARADGRPYIQHRGGPRGFLKVLDEHTLGFADLGGNRQYISLGNLSENDRSFIFLIDYENQQRIKIWGRARVVEDVPELLETLTDPSAGAKRRARRPRERASLVESPDRRLVIGQQEKTEYSSPGSTGASSTPWSRRSNPGTRRQRRRVDATRRAALGGVRLESGPGRADGKAEPCDACAPLTVLASWRSCSRSRRWRSTRPSADTTSSTWMTACTSSTTST